MCITIDITPVAMKEQYNPFRYRIAWKKLNDADIIITSVRNIHLSKRNIKFESIIFRKFFGSKNDQVLEKIDECTDKKIKNKNYLEPSPGFF